MLFWLYTVVNSQVAASNTRERDERKGASNNFISLYTSQFLFIDESSKDDTLRIETEIMVLERSLSTRAFETWTVTGSELFSLLTCPHTTTFTLLS